MSHTTYRVYLVTNTVTGARYVGVTTMPLSERMVCHYTGHSSLSADVALYGRRAFRARVLETHADRETAYARESALIVELGTMRPQGYNLTFRGGKYPGRGGAGLGNKNARHTPIAMYYRTRLVGEFDSVRSASIKTGVHRTAIQRALSKPHYRPGGFRVVQQGTAA